jgi:hypothetical protein
MEPQQQRPDPDGAIGAAASSAGEVLIGIFGARAWRVSWHPDTGAVHAVRLHLGPPAALPPGDDGSTRCLGRFPSADYVHRAVADLDAVKGSAQWRVDGGIELLELWMARVARGVEGDVRGSLAAFDEVMRPRYLDLGRTVSDVERARGELLAPEMWERLEALQLEAREALTALAGALRGRGNIGRAAGAAQDLAEVALQLHVALADGYRVAHETIPGEPPSEPS